MSFTSTQKRRLTKLADHLDTITDEHFAMESWFKSHRDEEMRIAVGSKAIRNMLHRATAEEVEQTLTFDTPEAAVADCGTAACVAGHAAALFKLSEEERWGYDWGDVVGDYLGLDYEQRDALFAPFGLYDRTRTPRLAARAVRVLRDTGTVPFWWRDHGTRDREKLANEAGH